MNSTNLLELSYYRDPDPQLWLGRKDGPAQERFFQIVQTLTPTQLPTCMTLDHFPTVALMGFASDEGVYRNQGRTGASFGPSAIRKALGNFPLALNSENPLQLFDLGDIVCANNDLENAQQLLEEQIQCYIR